MGKADPTPFGILLVFLVLPEGVEFLIRSPVGDLKKIYATERRKNLFDLL